MGMKNESPGPNAKVPAKPTAAEEAAPAAPAKGDGKSEEIGGPKGLEPTRFGDWERNGRCVDF
jgi:hypothetical protein